MEPSNRSLLATESSAFLSNSVFVSSGVSALASDPNNWVESELRSSAGAFANRAKTSRIVPVASSCMSFASCPELSPSWLNALICDLVAASPFIKALVRLRNDVAATSGAAPAPIIAVPNAAIDCSLIAICPFRAPTRIMKFVVSAAVAAKLLDRWLIESARAST